MNLFLIRNEFYLVEFELFVGVIVNCWFCKVIIQVRIQKCLSLFDYTSEILSVIFVLYSCRSSYKLDFFLPRMLLIMFSPYSCLNKIFLINWIGLKMQSTINIKFWHYILTKKPINKSYKTYNFITNISWKPNTKINNSIFSKLTRRFLFIYFFRSAKSPSIVCVSTFLNGYLKSKV